MMLAITAASSLPFLQDYFLLMYEAKLTQKSLSHQASFCWSMWWICQCDELEPVTKSAGKYFLPYAKYQITIEITGLHTW